MEAQKIEVGVYPRSRLSWDSFFMLEYIVLIWFDITNTRNYGFLMQLCMQTDLHFHPQNMTKNDEKMKSPDFVPGHPRSCQGSLGAYQAS